MLQDFDKIFCLHELSSKIKHSFIQSELDRINISRLSNFEWYYLNNNKYYDQLFYSNDFKYKYINIRNLSYYLNVYNLLTICKELNYSRILLINDDIAFLKDLQKLRKYFDDLPIDNDLTILGYSIDENISSRTYQKIIRNKHINEYYLVLKNYDYHVKPNIVSISKNGIQQILNSYNKNPFQPFYSYLNQIKHKYNRFNIGISNIPIGIQRDFSIKEYSFPLQSQFKFIDNSMYNI